MESVHFFDPQELEALADEYRGRFATAQPFPHVVIDDFMPEDVLTRVVSELPEPEEWDRHDGWRSARRADAIKLSVPNDWTLGPNTRLLLNQFNSAVFINFVERLTGITALIPDPHYFGGGLHQIESGGFLKIHADFNIHHRLHLDRRLNAILYLNRDWQDEWGGHLELWDPGMTHAVEKIAPLFNRLVVFATTDTSFHGHPDPLTCPPGVRRRSLALYYYSNGRPEEEVSESHGTLHQVRPGEDFDPNAETVEAAPPRRPPITWRDFVPPVASRIKQRLVATGRNGDRGER